MDVFLFLKSCAEWDMEELRLEGEELSLLFGLL